MRLTVGLSRKTPDLPTAGLLVLLLSLKTPEPWALKVTAVVESRPIPCLETNLHHFMKQYLQLEAGDVRQEGDETRLAYFRGKNTYDSNYIIFYTEPWKPVSLVGHSILPADLIVSQFRRLL